MPGATMPPRQTPKNDERRTELTLASLCWLLFKRQSRRLLPHKTSSATPRPQQLLQQTSLRSSPRSVEQSSNLGGSAVGGLFRGGRDRAPVIDPAGRGSCVVIANRNTVLALCRHACAERAPTLMVLHVQPHVATIGRTLTKRISDNINSRESKRAAARF